MIASAWQAHKAKSCEKFCWYCEHPPTGSTGWRLFPRSVPTRQKLGKAATRAAKRAKVKELKRGQALLVSQ